MPGPAAQPEAPRLERVRARQDYSQKKVFPKPHPRDGDAHSPWQSDAHVCGACGPRI